MKKLTAFILSAMMVLSLVACGAKTDAPAADSTTSTEITDLTYAVEAGSAGEEVAGENGFKTVSVDSQAKALMEVQAGTADAAIIDSLMAGAMVGEGTSYPNLTVTDQKLTEELYGVGCRKGSDLASFINSVLADAYATVRCKPLPKPMACRPRSLSSPPLNLLLPRPTAMCSTSRIRARWSSASPNLSPWIIRMPTVTGSVLTPILPSW